MKTTTHSRLAFKSLAYCSALLLIGSAARAAVPQVPAAKGPLAKVNIMQGTASVGSFSHGNTLPLVSAPFAMTDWSIQNQGGVEERWFYHADGTQFVGFRATHQPSPWMGDYGQFIITPQTGPARLEAADRAAEYDPKQAVMRPDYVKVRLEKYKLTAELTASERCGVMRLQFDPAQKTARLVFDIAGDCQLLASGNRIIGYSKKHNSPAAGDFKCYFVAELDRPITGSQAIGSATESGTGMGYVEFDIGPKPTVELRLATSYISPDQATRNLKNETEGGFDAVQKRTQAAWDQHLSRITVEGTDDQEATFYSCLYRALKFPHKIYELDAGKKPIHYSPWDGKVHPGVAYTDSGLWDTYRTQFPFLAIAYPDQFGEIVQGWLNAYKEGGWLPQWPSPGGFRGMTGSHADAMVADAMAKGIKGFDYKTAYAALKHDAFDIPPDGPNPGGREGMANYLKLGYLPAGSAGYWVSTSLDYAYDDWCVAQAARLTGHDDDYRKLMKRSLNYTKLWDAKTQFMRGKDAQGNWADKNFDEFAWGGGYTESGPWQASWAVQHDALGLADLAGGPAEFGGILDKLFSQEPKFHPGGYGGEIHEMTEFVACKMGQYAGNNQPSFHIPYLYAAIGQPWKTEYWTRRACAELFSAGPKGYSGDEDNGSNACWYILSSMGIYPLTPGTPQYVLTSPVFKSVKIDLPGGKTFTVIATDNSSDNVYVKARTLNGKPYTNTWITQGDITAGGRIVDQMAAEPDKRDVKPAELPYSAKTEMAKESNARAGR